MRRYPGFLMLGVSLFLSVSMRADDSAPSREEPIYQGKTMTEWIADLKAPTRQSQRKAAQSLSVFGPRKEVVSALTATLKDTEDVSLIVDIAQTLGKFGPSAKGALPALRAAFIELAKPRDKGEKQGLEEARRAR